MAGRQERREMEVRILEGSSLRGTVGTVEFIMKRVGSH